MVNFECEIKSSCFNESNDAKKLRPPSFNSFSLTRRFSKCISLTGQFSKEFREILNFFVLNEWIETETKI